MDVWRGRKKKSIVVLGGIIRKRGGQFLEKKAFLATKKKGNSVFKNKCKEGYRI